MTNEQAALIAAAITCGAEGTRIHMLSTAQQYAGWLDVSLHVRKD